MDIEMDEEYSQAFRGGEEQDVTDLQNPENNEPDDMMPSDDAAEGATETPAAVVTTVEEVAVPVEPVEPVEAATDGDEQMSPEDMQRKRSWEGRLKKREEEIAAREGAMQPDIGGETISAVMDRAKELRGNGELDGLVSQFVEDFGLDTVAVMAIVGGALGGKPVSASNDTELASKLDELSANVSEAFSRMHEGAIRDAHEDFAEIAASEQFGNWVTGLDEDQQAKVVEALDNGTAGQIIKVLNDYKASLTPTSEEPAQEDTSYAEDAAGAVRGSSPLKLPTRAPTSPDDEYARAWSQM
jgi:hypothetical protein